MRDQADNKPFNKRFSLGGAASDGLGQMLQAMEELDSPENTPAGLEPTVWERFCLVRRAKVEGEQQVVSHCVCSAVRFYSHFHLAWCAFGGSRCYIRMFIAGIQFQLIDTKYLQHMNLFLGNLGLLGFYNERSAV